MTAPVTVIVAERPMVPAGEASYGLVQRPARKGDVVRVPCPDAHNDDPAKGCTGECDPRTGAFKHGDRLMRLTKEPEIERRPVDPDDPDLMEWGSAAWITEGCRLTGVWEDR